MRAGADAVTALPPPDADGSDRPDQDADIDAPEHRHDVDRALTELLEEVRIAQMGAQILLGFLLAVAYTTVIREASHDDRVLYAWAVAVTTGAVVLLLGIVPLHRLNFGLRARPTILVAGHVLALAGLALLAGAIVLSVVMAARMSMPDLLVPVAVPVAVVLVGVWLVLPLALRRRGTESGPPR